MDIIKLLGAIDFFLPYFPLGGDSIRSLFEKQLEKQADRLLASHAVKLGWDPQVVDFLMSKVTHTFCCGLSCSMCTCGRVAVIDLCLSW